jgi:hypothetical protein
MRGLTARQRELLIVAVARRGQPGELPLTVIEASDLALREIAFPAPEGAGWHNVDVERASFALRVDAAARAAGVWP